MPRRILSSDPNAGEPLSGGGVDEGRFQSWYHGMARKYDLNPNPDDPRHFYDYRAAFAAGASPDQTGHWPSKFKREGHPRLIIDGVDTRTGEPAQKQRRVLSSDPNAGTVEPELRQGKPQAWYEGAWESARNAIFGHPDRAEAKAAGVGLQPTPAEMADAGLQMAAVLGGPAAGAAAVSGLRGPVGAAGKWLVSHPRTVAAATGALPGVLDQSPKEALGGAAAGALLGSGGKAVDALKRVRELVAAGKSAEAQALIQALRQAAQAEGPAVVTAAGKAAPSVAAVVDRGKAAAGAHSALMSFAKEAAESNPKMGQKIWILLDESGAPSKVLTPDQAGAAARKGLKTTWVRNLWQ